MSSVITEQREKVIRENNTAQGQLKNILENTIKSSKELSILEALHGDLDFTVLKEYGLTNITKIVLVKGEITNITGLPDTLLHFECPDNFLVDLAGIPKDILHIEIPHNYFEGIDLVNLKTLEVLIVNDNKLATLVNLPSTLKQLNCDNNQLAKLDLGGILKLDTLIVSNNPITLIENLPDGIINFQMENTPGIEFRNSSLPMIQEEDEEVKHKKNVEDSLQEYFRLKATYENKQLKMKRTLFEKADSKRQAKQEILTVKAPCIKCKRPVGTIFTKKNGMYSAMCGDAQSPCKLGIEIFVGNSITPLDYMLKIFREDSEEIKDSIIRQKLDTLFNYTNEEESVKLFKKQLDEYTTNSKTFKTLFDRQNELFYNEDKAKLIEKKNGEIFRLLERNSELLKEYARTKNNEILKTAVQIQVREIIPEQRNLRNLKNEIMEISVAQKNNQSEYSLFQYPVALTKLDYNFGEPPRVRKFNK